MSEWAAVKRGAPAAAVAVVFATPLVPTGTVTVASEVGNGADRAGREALLRRFLSNDIPACLSFRPSSVLRQPLHSPLCSGWRALNTNEEYERRCCASWYFIFRQSPKAIAASRVR